MVQGAIKENAFRDQDFLTMEETTGTTNEMDNHSKWKY